MRHAARARPLSTPRPRRSHRTAAPTRVHESTRPTHLRGRDADHQAGHLLASGVARYSHRVLQLERRGRHQQAPLVHAHVQRAGWWRGCACVWRRNEGETSSGLARPSRSDDTQARGTRPPTPARSPRAPSAKRRACASQSSWMDRRSSSASCSCSMSASSEPATGRGASGRGCRAAARASSEVARSCDATRRHGRPRAAAAERGARAALTRVGALRPGLLDLHLGLAAEPAGGLPHL